MSLSQVQGPSLLPSLASKSSQDGVDFALRYLGVVCLLGIFFWFFLRGFCFCFCLLLQLSLEPAVFFQMPMFFAEFTLKLLAAALRFVLLARLLSLRPRGREAVFSVVRVALAVGTPLSPLRDVDSVLRT